MEEFKIYNLSVVILKTSCGEKAKSKLTAERAESAEARREEL
jgi:hypothetical protein